MVKQFRIKEVSQNNGLEWHRSWLMIYGVRVSPPAVELRFDRR
jgi:hypothetical protein